MKAITFTIDLKSFFLGILTVCGFLILVNFTPAGKSNPEPALLDTRRFQVVTSERESIIIDTKTGRFVVSPSYLSQPRWIKGDFEEIQTRDKNRGFIGEVTLLQGWSRHNKRTN